MEAAPPLLPKKWSRNNSSSEPVLRGLSELSDVLLVAMSPPHDILYTVLFAVLHAKNLQCLVYVTKTVFQ